MAEDKTLELLARKILPKKFELSIVFASDKLSKSLNTRYRNKKYVSNVLSFPLSKTSGEIFLNKTSIKRDAKKFKMGVENFTKYLLIHAILHLKGHKHSAKMEAQERKYLKKFKIPLPVHLKNGKKKLRGRN